MNWREKVDPMVRHHLEREIKSIIGDKKAYSKAKNPSNAQLWCAIGNLSKQIFDLNLKLAYIERALKDIIVKPKVKKSKKR